MNALIFYPLPNLEHFWKIYSRHALGYDEWYKRFVRPPVSISEESRYQYWIRCEDCVYSRGFGSAKLTAQTKASSHSLRKMHTVKVTQMDLKKLENTVIQISKPDRYARVPDQPPF